MAATMIRRFAGRLPIALIAALWASTGVATQAQTSSIFLLDLPGDRVGVRYSHGSLDRAVQVQDSFDLLVEDFRSWTRAKVNLVILLLAREEWSQSGMSQPYGMAEPAGGRGLALPSWGDDGTVDLWHGLLGTRLPTQPDQPMRGTPEQSASLAMADLVGAIDAARILLRAGGIRGDEPWVDRVVAQVVVLSHLQSHHAARLPDVRMVLEDLAARGGGSAAWPLSVASSPRDLAARLWFESQFFDAAVLLTGPGCKVSPKAIFKQARKDGGRILAADLLGKCPELSSWMARSFEAE
jgi:hypothetical protein